ncbi:claudin-4-like isoform X2 [Xiphophorus couchianus]|uniref:claudin-4-like isoform X2 n=1 Tax=Xiphophorus couchianus TaxID=32473 RepID=UPI00101613B5|nr:claudin-4-like isoform X2 [Xiphophorus couchianus]XP_027898089.1 claudin-4-like isoform X2 [Xiphophorus couchianus]
MASKTVQMVFVVLGAIGLILVITCCALPEWAVGHYGYMELHVGLWKTCVKQRTGQEVCRTFDGSLMSSENHAFRALIVISCILGILSLLLLFFGSDFTPCVQNQDTKTKMILAAGLGLMLTGLLVIIPVNREANAPVWVGEVRMGACIYIGYLTGLMLIPTGVLLCCFGRPGSSSLGEIVSCLSNRV